MSRFRHLLLFCLLSHAAFSPSTPAVRGKEPDLALPPASTYLLDGQTGEVLLK